MWRGQEREGQQGVVEYRASDADPGFFVPYVLTRRMPKRSALFPKERKISPPSSQYIVSARPGPDLSPTEGLNPVAGNGCPRRCERCANQPWGR